MHAPVEFPAAIKAEAAEWVARRDAGLTAAGRTRFEHWLAADPRHRAALDWYGGPWAALNRPAQAGMADDVLQQLQVLDRRQRRQRIASVATATALLLIGGACWLLSPRAHRTDLNPTTTAKLVLPPRQVLPDGTTVDLKDDAEIAVNFRPDSRRVTLRRGEAHFQVAKNSTPFIVTASGAEFRAVGTAFSIQLGAKQVELLVTEGRVAVQAEGRGQRAEDRAQAASREVTDSPSSVVSPLPSAVRPPPSGILVDAGNRLVFEVKNTSARAPAPTAVSSTDIIDRLAWRVPRLEFTGTPLAEAVAMLNTQFARQNIRLVIDDPSIKRVKISGLFRSDKTAELIDLLETGFGIKSERRGDSEIVLRR